jgi:hypothetical protein
VSGLRPGGSDRLGARPVRAAQSTQLAFLNELVDSEMGSFRFGAPGRLVRPA